MRQEEENRPLRIYQCEDTQDGILTAVYEAGISGYGHKYIRIAPIREGETESFVLFAEYITVVTDPEHARIVLDKVQSGISRNAYEYVMYALASNVSVCYIWFYHWQKGNGCDADTVCQGNLRAAEACPQ